MATYASNAIRPKCQVNSISLQGVTMPPPVPEGPICHAVRTRVTDSFSETPNTAAGPPIFLPGAHHLFSPGLLFMAADTLARRFGVLGPVEARRASGSGHCSAPWPCTHAQHRLRPVLPRHKLRDRKGVDGPEQKDGAPLYISPGFVCRRKPGALAGCSYRLRWPDNPHPEGALRMIGRMVEDGARSIRSIRASFRIRMTTALAISGIESATTRRLLAGVGRRDGACRLDARHRRQPLPGRGGTGPELPKGMSADELDQRK